MNLLDVLLVLLVLVAIGGGLRLGFVARAASWLGLGVGVALATWTVPTALTFVEGGQPGVRLFVGLIVLAITVTVIASLFQAVGLRARRTIAATPLSGLDRALGAVAGAVAMVAVVWFLLPAAAQVPGEVSRQVRSSTLAATIERSTPEPPDAVRAMRNLVDTSRFPEVFADLQPAPVTGPPPEDIPVPQDIVDRATAATVNVEADGCNRRYEGSGFAIAADTVVTNAHVVAGAEDVVVKRPDGEQRSATVVVFDPDRDLAILAVPELGQDPLSTAPPEVGADGAVIGYPGGQDTPRVAPTRVDDQRTAVGRDIYGRDRTEREVLFLSSALQQGDSGSPVIDVAGNVNGVVFAISPDNPTVAFALALSELEAIVAAPRTPGETGPCI
ncbi:MarP family serine protease [Egicoccus sp. AB-alg6-2]|uniref:MarP family serine protease n=1 Tax=Egicoccus sp. AB-alg6-2 TaxID=3242692 RepID=UPI00359E8713